MRFPGRPIGVFGYSMGGRVALRVLDDPRVRVAVTAAAWVEKRDLSAMRPRPGLPVLLMHGARDRLISPAGSRVAADRLRGRGALADAVADFADGHGMLRYARAWSRRANAFLVGALGCPHCPRTGTIRRTTVRNLQIPRGRTPGVPTSAQTGTAPATGKGRRRVR